MHYVALLDEVANHKACPRHVLLYHKTGTDEISWSKKQWDKFVDMVYIEGRIYKKIYGKPIIDTTIRSCKCDILKLISINILKSLQYEIKCEKKLEEQNNQQKASDFKKRDINFYKKTKNSAQSSSLSILMGRKALNSYLSFIYIFLYVIILYYVHR